MKYRWLIEVETDAPAEKVEQLLYIGAIATAETVNGTLKVARLESKGAAAQ